MEMKKNASVWRRRSDWYFVTQRLQIPGNCCNCYKVGYRSWI